MQTPRSLNNSFAHGALAFLAYALGPILNNRIGLVVSCIVCVSAGWYRRAYLASFLGGIISAVVGWAAVGVLFAPETLVAALFMVPGALLVLLPVALAGFLAGKGIYILTHRKARTERTDG